MGNSIEKPKKYTVVFGDMEYDLEKERFECPPTTLNNKKAIPEKGREMPEGEITIKLGYAKYEKDENGKVVNVQFLSKEEAKQGRKINDDKEIIKTTVFTVER